MCLYRDSYLYSDNFYSYNYIDIYSVTDSYLDKYAVAYNNKYSDIYSNKNKYTDMESN